MQKVMHDAVSGTVHVTLRNNFTGSGSYM